MKGYPKALYSKDKDGVLLSVHVNSAEEEKPYAKWVDSPAKLGFETHPAMVDPDAPKVKSHPAATKKTVKTTKGKKNVRH